MPNDPQPRPLRVALIGTGFGARVQLPAFLGRADTTVVALCGRDRGKTARIADEHGVQGVYTDYEQMIAAATPDIVSITAPPSQHYPMTLAALEGGAHVLCEKPMAMDVTEAETMLAAARASGRVHVIDHEFRYLPARYYQRVLVDQGYIGEPVLLEATFMSPMRWDPDRPWNWWMDRSQGGGVFGAIGSHFIDAFHWLSQRRVHALTATLHTTPAYRQRPLPEGGTREVTSDDGAVLSLEFENDLRGVINLSAVAGGSTERLAVHGTEGALVVEDNLRLYGRRRGEPLREIAIPSEYEPPMWVPQEQLLIGPFAKLVGLMADAIHGEAIAPLPSFEDGWQVQRVIDAARRSAEAGCRVELI